MVESHADSSNPRLWVDCLLHGARFPRPPDLGSDRVKRLAGRGLLAPRSLTESEIQELSAAVLRHLVDRKV